MRRALRTGLVAAWLAFVAATAQASDVEHEVALDLRTLLFAALNLLLLLGVLVYFVRKPLSEFLDGRRQRIQSELKAAAELRAEAEARYSKWQRRLMELEGELEGIRAGARERAAAERARILADAAASAERIRADARGAVDQELRRARAQLRQEAASLAVELAAQTLERQVSDADQDRLLEEFVRTIETAPASDAVRSGPAR
jgi:F-type H+-transporting ATPase subunit b